jgi:hypothetical protein
MDELSNQSSLLAFDRQGQVKCFASTFTINWNTLKLLVFASMIFFFTIILTSSTSNHPGISSAIMVSGSSLTIFVILIAHMVYKEARREYDKSVAEGKWQEGVFVFSTGDVVVRFNRPTLNLDQEFPAGSISSVQGNEQNKIVYILWTDPLGHKMTFNVDCARLVDKPSFIAQEMTRLLALPSTSSSSSRPNSNNEPTTVLEV